MVFLYCGHCYFDPSKRSEHIFHQRFQLTAPQNATEELRGGVKSLGVGEPWERKSFFFFFTPLRCVIPWTNARLCVRAPWAQCEDTAGAKTVFGTKRKHFPTPLLWHSAQSPLVVAGFSQHLGFKAAKTFSPRERLTGKIKTCSPYWATMQVNLINAITGLVTKSYQDGVH